MNVQGMTKRKLTAVGNYRFTGKILGKGNFARVEEAYHEMLGTRVAVKIMDLNNIKEEYVVKNLFREAKIMSKLRHPCIISLFETMQKSNNIYYLVTEVVSGGDLCTYVKAQHSGKLDEKTARYFSQQFASAISYMHHRGIVHRDLKMENVILNSVHNQIKIVDFGLSNEWSPDAPLKTHCGSPEYAAPELFITSKVYGPEVDLWSLGIIIYGMVVGQLPFVSNKSANISSQERRKQLVAQINKGISVSQRKAIASFSADFRSLMSSLLNADSKKRIDIKTMIIHPWITENGQKIIKTNPLKKVSTTIHNKMMQDISSMCDIPPNEIPKIIEKNPFGTIGGLLNIMVHRNVVRPFTPDSLTKCISDTSTLRSMKSLGKQKPEYASRLSQTARIQENTLTERISRPHTTSTCNLSRTKTILTQKSPQLSTKYFNIVKENSSLTKSARPRSVQLPKNPEVKEVKRPATSALHKRREYSAIVASRHLQQSNSKSIKPKTISINDDTTPRKICEFHRKIETPTRVATNRLSDSMLPKRTPRIPTPISSKRRSSAERSKNIKSSSATEAQKNPYTKAIPELLNLIKTIVPYIDVQKNVPDELRRKSSAKSGPNKSTATKHSSIPIKPRTTPARTKLRSSQQSSINIEKTVPNSRRLRNENKW